MGERKAAVGTGLWAIVHEECELCELFVSLEQANYELARVQELVPELAEKLSVRPIPASLELSAN